MEMGTTRSSQNIKTKNGRYHISLFGPLKEKAARQNSMRYLYRIISIDKLEKNKPVNMKVDMEQQMRE
jgi:hypothetical protein